MEKCYSDPALHGDSKPNSHNNMSTIAKNIACLLVNEIQTVSIDSKLLNNNIQSNKLKRILIRILN